MSTKKRPTLQSISLVGMFETPIGDIDPLTTDLDPIRLDPHVIRILRAQIGDEPSNDFEKKVLDTHRRLRLGGRDESELQGFIMTALGDHCAKHGGAIFRNNTGFDNRNEVRYGLVLGGSDLIGISPKGAFVAIEVKTLRGIATPEQLNFIAFIRKNGGFAGIARKPSEAIAIFMGEYGNG